MTKSDLAMPNYFLFPKFINTSQLTDAIIIHAFATSRLDNLNSLLAILYFELPIYLYVCQPVEQKKPMWLKQTLSIFSPPHTSS